MASSLVSVFDSHVLQRLSFDSVAFLLGWIFVCFAIAAHARFAAKGLDVSLKKPVGKKQKKAKRSHKKSARCRQANINTDETCEASSSDPETTADIEVSRFTGDDDASRNVDMSVKQPFSLEATVETHTTIDAQHDCVTDLHSHSEASPHITDENYKLLSGPDCHCSPVIGTNPSDSQAFATVASADKVSDDSICNCCGEFFWGCQRCTVYSSALLLAHRQISIRIAEGPPGLSHPLSSADEEDDQDDWQVWLASQ